MPGAPSTLSHCVRLPAAGSTLNSALRFIWSALIDAYSCAPTMALTWSPTAQAGFFEATTTPTPTARITSPMPTGGR